MNQICWTIGFTCTLLLSVLSQWGLAETNRGITLPSDPMTFQAAPGSHIAASYCVICHSAEYVYMQPPHPREKWNEIVRKMKKVFGCPVPEENIPTLVTYLVGQNRVQPIPTKKAVSQPVSSETERQGSSERGENVFTTHCVNCHGVTGKGDGPIGKALVPPAADLTKLGHKSDEVIRKIIEKGRPGTAMPSWKNDLSPRDIQDVLAYIRFLTE